MTLCLLTASEDVELQFRPRSLGSCSQTSNYTLRQAKIILSFVPNHHVIMTYKGDHIMQQAFIISALSVNDSLNCLPVVGPEKEFLVPNDHNTV